MTRFGPIEKTQAGCDGVACEGGSAMLSPAAHRLPPTAPLHPATAYRPFDFAHGPERAKRVEGLPPTARHTEGGQAYRRSGFTLLELLVVIFIMLALTAIAVTSLRGFMDVERVKLAGTQVESGIRLARQYAMSRRNRCMVEFVDPPDPSAHTIPAVVNGGFETPGLAAGTYTGSPVGATWTFSGGAIANNGSAWGNPNAPEGVQKACLQTTATISQSIPGFMASAGYTVKFKAGLRDYSSGPPNYHDFKVVLNGTTLGTYTTTVGAYTEFTTPEVKPGAGTKLLQFVGLNTAGGDHTSCIDNVTITETTAPPPPPTVNTDIIPRLVRIIPYIRMYNEGTGGFDWVLDQDNNFLKILELPKNVHFTLAPAKDTVQQYDPASPLTNYRVDASKVYFRLDPDGTCSSKAPLKGTSTEEKTFWAAKVNSVYLRDLTNNNLALICSPPNSAFTRLRCVVGTDEVNVLLRAYCPYTLW